MSPLVSQLISMDAPETSSHTFSVTFDGFSVFLLFSMKAKKKKKMDPWTDFHLFVCWTHLPRRSGCKGWSTSGYTAAGRTSQSLRDASSPDWPVLRKPALLITWIAFTSGKRSVAAYPLVDRVVLAVVELLVEVEDPQGRAGVEVVVVKHTVNCDVLPRTYHHFFRDVAHLCKHTHCFEDNVIVNWRKRIKTDACLIFLEKKFHSEVLQKKHFFCPNLSDHFQNKCDSTWMMKWKKLFLSFQTFVLILQFSAHHPEENLLFTVSRRAFHSSFPFHSGLILYCVTARSSDLEHWSTDARWTLMSLSFTALSSYWAILIVYHWHKSARKIIKGKDAQPARPLRGNEFM